MEIKIMASFLLANCCFSGVDSAIVYQYALMKNNCPFTVWPAALTKTGPPILTGLELSPQDTRAIRIKVPWSGRIWGRFQCSNSSRFSCRSGDCNSGQVECNEAGPTPPATLIDFTLEGPQGNDSYDVSLVDGFNLPVFVGPDEGNCPSTACPVDINKACPEELRVRGEGNMVVGCKSACNAFNRPQYCCTGAYGTPATCRPTAYSEIFKSQCPQAYSYRYDDRNTTFICPTPDAINYRVTFCP